MNNDTMLTLPDGLPIGSYSQMLTGLLLGFFGGLIPLFWFKEAVFTPYQKVGIVAGVFLSGIFGLTHLYS